MFTPLLLTAHVPEAILVDWSCAIDQHSSGEGEPSDVVATFNNAARPEGLHVASTGSGVYQLIVRDQVLAQTTRLPTDSEPSCEYEASIERNGDWSLAREGETLARGTIEPPVVTGIGTDLVEVDSGQYVTVDITTVPHGPTVSTQRTFLRLAASILAAVSILLLVLAGRGTEGSVRARLHRSARARYRPWRLPLDHVVVILVLLVWWIVGPVLFDDGWVLATVSDFDGDGVYASYYDTFNAALPLGHLHNSLIRTFAAVTATVPWLRFPSLLAGIATWMLTRAVVDRAVRRLGNLPSLGVHLTVAFVFLLSWISWNNTLRPEPLIALLVAVGLWSSLQFTGSSRPLLLVVSSLSVGLALSMGTSGLVALAAPMASAPAVFAWIKRKHKRELVSLTAATMIGVTVLTLAVWGASDADSWFTAAQAYRGEVDHDAGWLDEPDRYLMLFYDGHSSSARRLSAMLPLIALIMFILRRRRGRDLSADLPALSLLASVALLTLTPSKWLWHFGSLTPLVASAVGVEWQRWRNERLQTPGSLSGSLVVLAITTVVSLVAWKGLAGSWNLLALQELNDPGRGRDVIGGALADPWTWLAGILVTLVALRFLIHSQSSLRIALGRSLSTVSSWLVPVSALMAVVLTVGVFAADGLIVSKGWSLSRQNLEGFSSCGLADDILVGSQTAEESSVSGRPTRTLQDLVDQHGGSVLVAPQLRMYFPCFRLPLLEDGVDEIPEVVVAIGGWPLGLAANPYHYLADIAHLQSLSTDRSDKDAQQSIEVFLVEES